MNYTKQIEKKIVQIGIYVCRPIYTYSGFCLMNTNNTFKKRRNIIRYMYKIYLNFLLIWLGRRTFITLSFSLSFSAAFSWSKQVILSSPSKMSMTGIGVEAFGAFTRLFFLGVFFYHFLWLKRVLGRCTNKVDFYPSEKQCSQSWFLWPLCCPKGRGTVIAGASLEFKLMGARCLINCWDFQSMVANSPWTPVFN